jgi:U6 snRNA phosphodiesterase
MLSLSDGIKPALHAILQREYYEKPRFHASIAWALLDKANAEGAESHMAQGKR